MDKKTNAKGIITKSGRYGSGTYAHEDIALEFASWISAEFKLYFIKEFRRLKNQESERFKYYYRFLFLIILKRCREFLVGYANGTNKLYEDRHYNYRNNM